MERVYELELREHTIINFSPVSISIDEQISSGPCRKVILTDLI